MKNISPGCHFVAHPEPLRALVDRVDLAALVEKYSGPGRHSGGTFTYSCPNPNHPDRHPSFTVTRDRTGRQRAACWSVCAWNGDALDLVEWLEGLDTGNAAKWLRDYLGDFVPSTYRAGPIPENRVTPIQAAALITPEDISRPLEGDRAAEIMGLYLASRSWGEEAVTLFDLEVRQYPDNSPRIRHKFFSPSPTGGWVLTYWQDRAAFHCDPKDRWRSPKNGVPTLFNLQGLEDKNLESVLICEGPADTISAALLLQGSPMCAVGIPGVSAWRQEHAPLFDGLNVVIAADNDEAGLGLEQRLRDTLTKSPLSLFRVKKNDFTECYKTAKATSQDSLLELRNMLLTAGKVGVS